MNRITKDAPGSALKSGESSPLQRFAADPRESVAKDSHTQSQPLAIQSVLGNRAAIAQLRARGQGEAPAVVESVLESPGKPLEQGVRGRMEGVLGRDFSRVRVHDDAQADTSARAVQAIAYAVGSDIVFRAGAPRSGLRGERLLLHELTHVAEDPIAEANLPIVLGDRHSAAERRAQRAPDLEHKPKTMSGKVGQRTLRRSVSFELDDTPPVSVETNQVWTDDETRVLKWLRANQSLIVAAESKYLVDRRAIAAAIAWEALENSSPLNNLAHRVGINTRGVGPGKVHVYESKYAPWKEGNPIARQAEEAGYLARRTKQERREILSTAAGAIEYIAGIMAAYSDIAARFGRDIRLDPVTLTQVYHGAGASRRPGLAGFEQDLRAKAAGAPLQAGNPMALWTREHFAYLQDCVGAPALRVRSEPSAPQSLQSEGRAKVAREFVANHPGSVYKQETPRNWQDWTYADCSKFVQGVLERSGEGDLFGRDHANTADMRHIINGMTGNGHEGIHADPRVGDLMLWTGHIGVVVSVSFDKSELHLSYANMGVTKNASIVSVKASAVPGDSNLGDHFLGYWSP